MKSGIVAVVGRANAGKSTLVNVMVGEKISIVSPKPQTTRERISGILNGEGYQIVFEDTPGLYRAGNRLNDFMQRQTRTTAADSDVILFVIDAHAGIKDSDLNALKTFEKGDIPVVVALTKTDIMPKEKIPEEVAKLGDSTVESVIPVSARRGANVAKLVQKLLSLIPEGEPIFPPDVVSDRSEAFMLREIMREKMLLCYDKEIPHGVAIVLNQFTVNERGVAEINLDIVCEKSNHKAIIIGKQGAKLKEVSAFAREGMEKFLGRKVFLTVYVKVKENWRDSKQLMDEYGYTDRLD